MPENRMATVDLVSEDTSEPRIKEIFADIRQTKNPNFCAAAMASLGYE